VLKSVVVKTKFIRVLLVALTMAVVLAACGDNTATNTAAPTTAAATTATVTTAAVITAAATTAAGSAGSSEALPAGLDANSLKADLNGSGSTLVAPALKVWQTELGKIAPNVKINYPGGGSGQGRSDFLTGKTDFGVSDVQLTADEAQKNNKNLADIIQIPATLAAVVFTFNLSGVTDLNISPDTACGIYTGKIANWNDAKIKADNPNASLPNTEIKFAVRADNSGTSTVFTTYLSAVCPDFKSAVGASGQPKWEGAGINVTTAPGNDGVAGLVKQTPGTLGYVEVAYALQNNLPFASVKNPAGKFVKPTLDSISVAAAGAKPDDNLKVDLINQPGDNAYPIATTTYILLNKTYSDAAKGQAVLGFVWYALHKGQNDAKAANYAPLPTSVVTQAEAKLKTVTAGGAAILK
jgi:phosphate transport system substrate-binding protein